MEMPLRGESRSPRIAPAWVFWGWNRYRSSRASVAVGTPDHSAIAVILPRLPQALAPIERGQHELVLARQHAESNRREVPPVNHRIGKPVWLFHEMLAVMNQVAAFVKTRG